MVLHTYNHRWAGEPSYNSPRVIREGDIVWEDLIIVPKDYCCDQIRDFFISKLDYNWVGLDKSNYSKTLKKIIYIVAEQEEVWIANVICCHKEKDKMIFELLGAPWIYCSYCGSQNLIVQQDGGKTQLRSPYEENEKDEGIKFFTNN